VLKSPSLSLVAVVEVGVMVAVVLAVVIITAAATTTFSVSCFPFTKHTLAHSSSPVVLVVAVVVGAACHLWAQPCLLPQPLG
jgi:hypothetical protein